MTEKKAASEEAKRSGSVVYSRLSTDEASDGAGTSLLGRKPLSPSLPALLIGFLLLVALVYGLGRMSVQRLRGVGEQVQAREQQVADRAKLLLEVRGAFRQLDFEARARGAAVASGGLVNPFDLKLRTARGEARQQLSHFEHLPLAQTPAGKAFRDAAALYIESTGDVEGYSKEGFKSYRPLEAELDEFDQQERNEREHLQVERLALINEAERQIDTLTFFAVLTGALIAAATTWEVQRRFRQLRRSLEETRSARQFSAQVLEGMVSAVAAIDARAQVRSANAAFLALFPAVRVGLSVDAAATSDAARKLIANVTSTPVEQATYRGRWTLRPDDNGNGDGRAEGDSEGNGQHVLDVYSSPLDVDGGRGQILTLVDATEAARAEAEVRRTESLAAVGQAAAQVAHEIKNPLGSIRLGVAMLRDMTGEAEAQTTIDLVERGIDHLNKLTLDVTQFSRAKQLTRAPADINQLLDASLELVADKLRDKRTPVEKHYAPRALTGDLDVDQLRQIFVNLLGNAIDANPEGAPLMITTAPVQPKSVGAGGDHATGGAVPHVRVTITDRGKGMDERTRARVFEPFFTTKKRGTGLGLAIVKKIVEQHGGTVTFESTPGQGTSFHVELPLVSTEVATEE